jgi:hypothetical protein
MASVDIRKYMSSSWKDGIFGETRESILRSHADVASGTKMAKSFSAQAVPATFVAPKFEP